MSSDNVTSEVRSRMMAGIRSKNTMPELAIRSALHRRGYRFRLHRKDLPGKPDILFPKYRAVILVHGCFWHGHSCHLFRWPKTRGEFWKQKINSNIVRDRKLLLALTRSGWRVATIWECSMKGRTRQPIESIAERCATWLESDEEELELRGYEIRSIK